MSRRPLVLVPTQTFGGGATADALPTSDAMRRQYCAVLADTGAAPALVPLVDDDAALRALYDAADGVFLAGGVDVEPEAYGAARQPWCGETDAARDRVELRLARWAVAEAKPLFAVCRGAQLVNVALGGTLHQDLAQEVPGALHHANWPKDGHARDWRPHAVRLTPGTRLAALLGAAEVHVNSMHHQGIARLAAGLAVNAVAPDGVVEGIEGTGEAFLLGVQWHPEDLAPADVAMRRLFAAFVAAAGARRGVPA